MPSQHDRALRIRVYTSHIVPTQTLQSISYIYTFPYGFGSGHPPCE